MIKQLVNEFNKTETANGATTLKSSLNANVDFFGLASAMRNKSSIEKINLFMKAFYEDATIAVRNLFYLRDIRGGQGERLAFREIFSALSNSDEDIVLKLIRHIPVFGRWDDLTFVLANTKSEKVKKAIIDMIKEQIFFDLRDDTPSLLAKWLPSENASSRNSKFLAKYIASKIGFTSKKYRKTLSELRKRINVLERLMSAKEWDKIEYDKIPSQAGMKYKTAFFTHDESRYSKFIDSLVKGEKTINSATLYPYQIVAKASRACGTYEKLYEGMWKNLPDYTNGEDAMVVADVSGSMDGTPKDVAISLAMYFAERNKGQYNGYFMTFSERPELVKISGRTLSEKIRAIDNAHWDMNTDIEALFMKLLNTAIKNNVPKDEMIKKLYIVSDMQFDRCVNGHGDVTLFETMKRRFKAEGYDLPSLVFWNVNAEATQIPVNFDETNTALVSGCSPSIFKYAVSNITPESFMLEVLNSERYSVINL